MTPKRMTDRAARTLLESAELVKAPDWSETHRWHVVADGKVLIVVEPSYGGASRTGRNGWRWWLADLGPSGSSVHSTRQTAASAGMHTWLRWITRPA